MRALLGAQRLLLDRELRAMFEVIERDEPSHFEPHAGCVSRVTPLNRLFHVVANSISMRHISRS